MENYNTNSIVASEKFTMLKHHSFLYSAYV